MNNKEKGDMERTREREREKEINNNHTIRANSK